MITIYNRQRKIKLNIDFIYNITQKILDILNYSDFDIGILITNNKTIRDYNKNYRKIDKPTDILSFGYHTELKAGDRIKVEYPEDKNLGDLILSAEYIKAYIDKQNLSLETEDKTDKLNKHIEMLLVHGICHLLGYDHIMDSDYRKMRAKESYILRKLKN